MVTLYSVAKHQKTINIGSLKAFQYEDNLSGEILLGLNN